MSRSRGEEPRRRAEEKSRGEEPRRRAEEKSRGEEPRRRAEDTLRRGWGAVLKWALFLCSQLFLHRSSRSCCVAQFATRHSRIFSSTRSPSCQPSISPASPSPLLSSWPSTASDDRTLVPLTCPTHSWSFGGGGGRQLTRSGRRSQKLDEDRVSFRGGWVEGSWRDVCCSAEGAADVGGEAARGAGAADEHPAAERSGRVAACPAERSEHLPGLAVQCWDDGAPHRQHRHDLRLQPRFHPHFGIQQRRSEGYRDGSPL